MGPKTDYTKPQINDDGWGYCPYCPEMQYIQGIQDLTVIGGDLVPDVYRQCTGCWERWTAWRHGDYDALVALYQMRARGLRITKITPS